MENKEPRVSQDGLSREEKVKYIYDEVANRSLTRGCVISKDGLCYFIVESDPVKCLCRKEGLFHNNSAMVFIFKDGMHHHIVKGHPVMIGDILDWVEKGNIEEKQHEKIKQRKGEGTQYTYTPVNSMILALYKEKREPIEEQTDYLIDYVFSLLEATTDHVSS